MPRLFVVVIAALAGLACAPNSLAQDNDASNALAASRQRLEKALEKTAALQDTAFEARWGPDKAPKADNPFAVLMGGRNSGKASGSWHPTMALCKFDGDEGDELVTAGRRTIARSANHDWTVRSGRFADGNPIGFAPDVDVLLQQLDEWQLAVVHREVGSIDDRPVEIVTVTLNDDQVAEAVYCGALPPALVSGFSANMIRLVAGGGRTAPPQPKAVVDIAIAIDPATSLVQRLQFRAYAEQGGRGGMAGQVLIQRVGGNVQVAGQESGDEEEEDEAAESGPMQFENGLPMRSRKNKSVSDYTVTLSQHGQVTAPGLTAAQKKLLRL